MPVTSISYRMAYDVGVGLGLGLAYRCFDGFRAYLVASPVCVILHVCVSDISVTSLTMRVQVP